MPRTNEGTSRIANVAPTARIESDATRVIQPIATTVTDLPNPEATPLSHSAGYPGIRKAARVELEATAATDRARKLLVVTASIPPLRSLRLEAHYRRVGDGVRGSVGTVRL